MHLVGDSAGGNLVLQLLSHILHPLPSVPELVLPKEASLRGAYLMSPWVSLLADPTFSSFKSNDKIDMVDSKTLRVWGERVLAPVAEKDLVYIDPINAPVKADWFQGLERVVDRILITTGSKECLRDPDEALSAELRKQHEKVQFIVQENGLHDDPYLDFNAGEKNVGVLTPLLVEWIAEGSKL